MYDKSFDDNHNWFEKFLEFGFKMPVYEQNYKQHKFIEAIYGDKVEGSHEQISKRLGIQVSQVPKFLQDYNANKNKRCYIFRFGSGTIQIKDYSILNGTL